MIHQPEIRTDRLLLRPFIPEDATVVQKLAGSFNVSRTTLNIPYPYPAGAAEKWIEIHASQWRSTISVVYAIAHLDTSQLVGAVSLVDISAGRAELGYWIGEPYWGSGYCSEAAAALIEFSFDRLGLKTIYAEHLQSNPASGKVMQNVGMRHIKTVRKADRYRKIVPVEIYELHRSDFGTC